MWGMTGSRNFGFDVLDHAAARRMSLRKTLLLQPMIVAYVVLHGLMVRVLLLLVVHVARPLRLMVPPLLLLLLMQPRRWSSVCVK